jgi:hypothetical protein
MDYESGREDYRRREGEAEEAISANRTGTAFTFADQGCGNCLWWRFPPTRRNRSGSGDLPLKGGGQAEERAVFMSLTSPLEGEVAAVGLATAAGGGERTTFRYYTPGRSGPENSQTRRGARR